MYARVKEKARESFELIRAKTLDKKNRLPKKSDDTQF